MRLSHTLRGRSTPFPVCRLHGIRIVNALPSECPYRAEHRLDALAALQGRAYGLLMRADPSGLDLLRQVEICEVCRLPRHVLNRLKRPRAGAASGLSPTCPKCGKAMKLRHRKDGSEMFWGCSGYPKCRQTLPADGRQPPQPVPLSPRPAPKSRPLALHVAGKDTR